MTDHEAQKSGEVPRRFRPEKFIRRLQAEGFVQWDRFTWIHPKDIPVFVAKGRIKRWRRRRAEFMAQALKLRIQIPHLSGITISQYSIFIRNAVDYTHCQF